MKKLFSEYVYDMIETENGFMFTYRLAEVEGKTAVAYRSVSIDDGIVTKRTRSEYEYLKFGNDHNFVDLKLGNFVTCSCVKLEKGRVFLVSADGNAKISDAEGNTEWEGTIRYKDCGPSAIAHHGHTLWASFADKNALIRFNLRTMREELRIGGSNDSSFSGPEGLWVDDASEKLIVCNTVAKNLLEVNLKTYTVVERAAFDEPVHKYLRIGKREFVVLDSGLYIL